MIKKFLSAIFLIAIIVVVIYVIVTNSKNSEVKSIATSQEIKIGFPIQSLDAAPIIVAYQKGYFQEQGLNVTLMHLQSSEGALAVGSGQVDIDVTGAARLFGPIGKGAPVKLLSLMGDMSAHLFIRPDSGIVTLKDLEGKRVSRGPAGSNILKFTYILGLEGVDVAKVEFVDIDKLYLPTALMDQKVIDAALIDEPVYVNKAKELGAIVLPYWYEKNYQKIPNGSSVAVNTDFLKNNEESVTKFYNALIQAHRYLKDNLEDSAIIVTSYLKENTNGAMDMKPEEFVRQVNDGAVRYILWQDQTPIVEFAKINFDLGLSDYLLTADDLYDLRFKGLLEVAQNEIYGETKI